MTTSVPSPAPLREADIRPQHLNLDKEAAYARDVARLLRRRAEFVEVPCPACGETRATPKWRKWELDYLECVDCRTVRVSPRPSPAVLEEYYTHSELYEYWNRYIFPASEPVRRERIFRPRVERVLDVCARFGVATDTLVEVGAGFGTFCEEARATGRFRRIVAVEPTPALARSCRERGLEVIDRPVEHVDFSGIRASVVAAFEVLEHLFDPAAFVRACADVVAPGGVLVLTCPNGQGFEVEVLGTVADTVDTEHLNYFNPTSLARLVGGLGFEVLEVTTPGVLDADIVRNKALQGKVDLSGQRFLQISLLERWEELGAAFQEFLRDNRFSSHMWLIARRTG